MTKSLILAAALFGLSACSTGAALVRHDPAGGRVALHGAYRPAMLEARELMVDHGAGRYDMVERGDAVEFQCRTRSTAVGADALATRGYSTSSPPSSVTR